jgi:hypothetical protein
MCSTPLNKSEVNLKFTLNQSKPNPKSTLNYNPKPNINTTVHQPKTNPKQFLNNKKQSKYLQPSRNKTCSSPGNFLFSTLIDTTLPLQLHSTTLQLQLQLQLHYTTLHPAVVVRWPLQPSQPFHNTTPTTCRSISGFAPPSVIHNNQPLLGVSYFWNFRHRLVQYYWQHQSLRPTVKQ